MKDNRSIHLWKGINWLPKEYRTLTDKFVLVVNDIQNAIKLSLKNRVVFLTADEKHSNRYKNMIIGNEAFGKDDVLEVIDEWKIDKLENILDKYDMFDIAIMNPPYDGNLHLKILETVIPHAEKVVNISPASQMLNCVNAFKKTTKFIDSVYSHLTSVVKVFSIDEILTLFSTSRILVPIAIQEFENSRNDLSEFERINSHDGMKTIVKKVYDYAANIDNIEKHLQTNMKNGFRVKFGRIGGGAWTAFKPHVFDTFREIVVDGKLKNGEPHWKMNSVNQYTKKTDTINESIEFRSEQEAQNFLDSYKTKFMQTCVGFLHTDMNIHPEYLPFMNDYTQPWTNERFYEFFKLTPEEIKTIEEYVR